MIFEKYKTLENLLQTTHARIGFSKFQEGGNAIKFLEMSTLAK
jgi:hypothetical protein